MMLVEDASGNVTDDGLSPWNSPNGNPAIVDADQLKTFGRLYTPGTLTSGSDAAKWLAAAALIIGVFVVFSFAIFSRR